MGEVWKAHDTRLDRMVAIKVSGARFSDRFEREARAVAALNHPNICTLYDVGPDYLVMEYIDGAPVAPLESVRKLVDLATQIADGLSAAHAAGIVHRDLKPGNILVTREGRVKILDFGLAKSTAPVPDGSTGAVTVTQPGLVLGTVAYMSPEQARGIPLDARSDQFSFGLLLYELRGISDALAVRGPDRPLFPHFFPGNRGIYQLFTRTLGSTSSAQLTHLKSPCIFPFWSPDGSTIYVTSVNDTWAVPASGGEPQMVLKNGRIGTVHPDGRTFSFVRNNRLWIGPLAEGQAKEYFHPSFPSSQLGVLAARFSPDGSRLAVAALSPAGEPSTWIIRYPSGAARRVAGRKLSSQINWFPDSRRLVGGGSDGVINSLMIVDTESGRIRTIYKSSETSTSPSVSPDGKRIVYQTGASETDLIEIALPSGAISDILTRGGTSSWPDWAPSGTHYLFSTDIDGESAIDDRTPHENATRRLISVSSDYLPARPDLLAIPRWAPDGQRFTFEAVTTTSRRTWVANTSGGRPLNLDPSADSSGASWSPDGRWIAYLRSMNGVLGKAQVAKVGTSAGATPQVFADFGVLSVPTQWSPAGDWILYGSNPGLALVSPDGQQHRALTPERIQAACFSRGGDQVYGIVNNREEDRPQWELISIDVKTGSERRLAALNPPAATRSFGGFSLHPDGKRIATAVYKWPTDIWMLEGFDQGKSWVDRLLRR
jgi:serine/threonine protein kinase